jgi:hypothetical protein
MTEYMSRETILAEYKDGDERGWDKEFDYLEECHAEKIAALVESVKQNGILEPILLGNDGRVWDGHHRLTAAWLADVKMIPVIRA